LEEFGTTIERAMMPDVTVPGTATADATLPERLEWFWAHVVASFQKVPGIWRATLDVFSVALGNPEIRAAIADGLEDARRLWSQALYRIDDSDAARAVSSLHPALLSGLLIRELMDPQRAPSASDLGRARTAISNQITAQQPNPDA
jgi:hypothetical protein